MASFWRHAREKLAPGTPLARFSADDSLFFDHVHGILVITRITSYDAGRTRDNTTLGEEHMITGVIKNKVDKIWTDIWAGGITNPLTVIEQLTYLMFIRSLDEKELETEAFENLSGEASEKIFPPSAAGQSMRWSKFKDRDPREIFDILSQRVFPAIKNLKNGKLLSNGQSI